MQMSSNISDFFADKSVFITGSTGFVGKVLLEKLLYSCPKLRTVYVLMRPKGGQTADKRLKNLLSSQVFDRIRLSNACQLVKVVAVCGDVTYEELGLNPMDKQTLLDNVSVVFNSAATIRFDEPLRRALHLNVLSTQRVLRLVQRFSQLTALVHVSTAYCTADKSDVKENIFLESVSPQNLLDSSVWMDDQMMTSIAEHLYGGRPSSYHYTKALAEQLLAQEGNDLPLAIVRPSIITASWREPMPGWVDNYNGLSGYLVAAGKGVLRTMRAHSDYTCDIVPVDIVVNTCISAAFVVANRRHISGPLVLNCTSGSLNPITWREIRTLSDAYLVKHPSMELFRYPGPQFHSSQWLHRCHLLVEHTIPAFVVDLLFRACGLAPILGPVYQKLNRSLEALQYFTCNEWTFHSQNQSQLLDSMSVSDSELFCADIRLIDWNKYFEEYVLGIRLYLLHEKSETLPKARHQIQRLYSWTQFAKLFISFAVLYKFYAFYRQKRLKNKTFFRF